MSDTRVCPFTIDTAAVKRAAFALEIESGVTVRTDVTRHGEVHATYRPEPTGEHGIIVRYDITAAEASRAIWHELAHARQKENGTLLPPTDGIPAESMYAAIVRAFESPTPPNRDEAMRAAEAFRDYKQNPNEIEASEVAALAHPLLSLATATPRTVAVG
jgi:hypothetical protein